MSVSKQFLPKDHCFDEEDDNDIYFQPHESDSPGTLNTAVSISKGRSNKNASNELFSQYILQHTNSTTSSVVFQQSRQQEEETFESFELISTDSCCSSGILQQGRTKSGKKKSSEDKKKSMSSTSCGICFDDYFPYPFDFGSSSSSRENDDSTSLALQITESSSSVASSDLSGTSTPTSSPVKQSTPRFKSKNKKEKRAMKNPKSFNATSLVNHDNMVFDEYCSNDDPNTYEPNEKGNLQKTNQSTFLPSWSNKENEHNRHEPVGAHHNHTKSAQGTMTPNRKETITKESPSTRKRTSSTNSMPSTTKHTLSTPPRYPKSRMSTPPHSSKLSSTSSTTFGLPSPSSIPFTPKSSKLRIDDPLAFSTSLSSLTSASPSTRSHDNQLQFTLPSFNNSSTRKNHTIQDLDEESHYLYDDDDCTVRVSNMQSTQYNKVYYGTPPRLSSRKTIESNENNDDHMRTNPKEFKSTIIINDEDLDANNLLFELREEWNVQDKQENDNVINNELFPSNDINQKKKKNIIQKTSSKVKKILNRSNSTINSTTDGSVRSDEAAVASDHSTQYNQSKLSSTSQQFADLWLKRIMNGEEILLNHSKENILLGTPLQIGTKNDQSNSNNNIPNPKTKKRANSLHSPLKMTKSNTFSYGTKQSKLKRVGSDLMNKVNSPSRKIANMMTNLKHRSTQSGSTMYGNSSGRFKQYSSRHSISATKDDAIKGRLDGIDIISLGSCRCVSYIGSKDKALAGQRYTLRSMVSDTLWASSGSEFPEMVLEGITPSGNDRWTVLIEEDSSFDFMSSIRQRMMIQKLKMKKQNNKRNKKSRSGDECDKVSNAIPTPLLMTQIWGKEGPPPSTHSVQFEKTDGGIESRSSGGLRAISSCPVDSEKNIFVIQESDHLNSAHSIAVVPLKFGKFDESIAIFNKILRSLEHKFERMCGDHHLIGSCHHNIGVIHMWSGNYEESIIEFNKAVNVRTRTLTLNHQAVAVSLSKVGLAYFALEQLDNALEALEKALNIRKKILQHGSLEIAKLLNNIASIHYQKGDTRSALKKFNVALEIMKIFMEGPIRRESIVYDTSIILTNIGKIHLERKKYDLAYRMLEEALMVQTSTLKRDHDGILLCLGNLAYARSIEGENNKALQIYKSLFRMQVQKFGKTSSEVTETKGMMGLLYIKLGQYQEAHRCLKGVKSWQKHNLNEHHPALFNTRQTISKLKEAIKGANESFAAV